MRELNDKYKVSVLTAGDILLNNNLAISYEIPVYQRPFDWNTDSTERFFETLFDSFALLKKNKDSHAFLGNIILLNCSDTVQRGDSFNSSNSRIIIDGQQRITTITLILSRVYQEMIHLYYEFLQLKSEESFTEETNWMLQMYTFINSIKSSFRFQNSGKNIPKIVRESDDDRVKGEFASDIARFYNSIPNYSIGIERKTDYQVDLNIQKPTGKIELVYDEISNQLKKIQVGNLEKQELNDSWYQEGCFHGILSKDNGFSELPSILEYYTGFEREEKARVNFEQSIRLMLITLFLRDKLLVSTFILPADFESEALTLFDSLNTTGQPLTALQTLSAKIALYYKNERKNDTYGSSNEIKTFKQIEDYLK